jgi:hypothetical protein
MCYSAEGRALSVPSKLGGAVNLADVGAVSSKLLIWRTGFRYVHQDVVGFGTGVLEAGSIFFGACVSFITLGDCFLSSPDDAQPLITGFKNTMPRDTEGFILLDENGASSQKPVQYGDVVILRRMNGRYLNCTEQDKPAFRSTAPGNNEKFRIWF